MPSVSVSLRTSTSYVQQREDSTPSVKQFQEVLHPVVDAAIRTLVTEPEISDAFRAWQESLEPKWRPFVETLLTDSSLETESSLTLLQQGLGTANIQPFKSGIVLHEPKPRQERWSVSLCMVDRKQPAKIVAMAELERGEHPWRSNPISQLKQDVKRLQQQVPPLSRISLSEPTLSLEAEEAYALFTKEDSTLEELGFHLIVPKWLQQQKPMKVLLKMNATNEASDSEPMLNWQSLASFTYEVAIGEATLTAAEFANYVKGQRPFVHTNNQWISWDPQLAEQLRSYLDSIESSSTYLEAWHLNHRSSTPFSEEADVSFSITWDRDMSEALKSLYRQSVPLIRLPARFTGELRPYQHEGASWLVQLRRSGFGGCLADDMGLGKSIQTLAYILYVLETQQRENKKNGPFLLICPTSLIHNWLNECQLFAPTLRLFVHHGPTRLEHDLNDLQAYDLVITSYQLAVRDQQLLSAERWNGLILDEAQHIKNIETKQRRVIKALRASHRLALTGTPLENRLRELWSLMDVLNPAYFGSYRTFQEQFIKPIEKTKNKERLKQLRQLIYPFILRRKKSDQSLDLGLPEKKEQIHKVHLSVEQAALYQAVVDELAGQLDVVSHMERRSLILRSLTKLKQICNHPAHFLKENDVDAHHSEKWDKLLQLTEQIVAHNEKVLIFSQYKEMGKLITATLNKHFQQQIPFLHGSLTRSKRQEAIQTFQDNSSVPAFVLSLKAGASDLT